MADVTASVLKEVSSLVKVLTDLLSTLRIQNDIKPTSRSGPLQVLGRLYFALTAILALFASTSAYLDIVARGSPKEPFVQVIQALAGGTHIRPETVCLRWSVIAAVAVGLLGVVVAIFILLLGRPHLLFSPSEYSADVLTQFISHHEGTRTNNPNVKKSPSPARNAGAPGGVYPESSSPDVDEKGDADPSSTPLTPP